jgi:L-asparagine transporter-like permease
LPAAVKIKARKYYLWLMALTMLAGVVTGLIIENAIIGYLFVMLFWTPLLAIFYLVISYKEAKQLQQ